MSLTPALISRRWQGKNPHEQVSEGGRDERGGKVNVMARERARTTIIVFACYF